MLEIWNVPWKSSTQFLVDNNEPIGFLMIRKSDRQINSGKINLLKKLPLVGTELQTVTFTHLKSNTYSNTARHSLMSQTKIFT